jgi:hypothetical protein
MRARVFALRVLVPPTACLQNPSDKTLATAPAFSICSAYGSKGGEMMRANYRAITQEELSEDHLMDFCICVLRLENNLTWRLPDPRCPTHEDQDTNYWEERMAA